MSQPDILVFMTDQHTPFYSGWLGRNVGTPNLDRLCAGGTRFDQAYTPCPLCVPARMAMLSTLLPHKTGVFTNRDALPDTQATFLHPLVAAGYETVLCGRMHFVGPDQRHGFTKRIAPDITATSWGGAWQKNCETRGVFATTFGAPGATAFAGGGTSPVLLYDELVIQRALDYLAQPHEKPQCLFVSVYAPHFPYVAPKELFEKYFARVQLSPTFGQTPPYLNAPLQRRQNVGVTQEKARAALAAYCGMIEQVDWQFGQIWEAFEGFTARRGSEKLICYVSDHGDQVGDRSIYGKDTFFEKSVKIPLIFAGDGVQAGRAVNTPVSLLDLGPTLWDWLGTERIPQTDGESLVPALRGKALPTGRAVVSELLELLTGNKFDPQVMAAPKEYAFGVMVRQGAYKYICYHGFNEMLFTPECDPEEQRDLIEIEPEQAGRLRCIAETVADPTAVEQRQKWRDRKLDWFVMVEQTVGRDDSEWWLDCPPNARVKPEICVE
ncbi:MAG: hypothetical protein DBX91_09005 [Subdoligranulum variabile]|nr:MAG: hypothetical protein DBX91_09005 [Subdoligranulum variabile]